MSLVARARQTSAAMAALSHRARWADWRTGRKVGGPGAELLAWWAAGLSVALAVPGLFFAARTYPSLSVFLSSPSVFNGVLALTFPEVGALIVAQRPENRIGWLFCVEGVANGLAVLAAQYARYTLHTNPGALAGGAWMAWLGSWIWVPGLGLVPFLLLLFPDGRLPSAGWQPVAWLAASWIALTSSYLAVLPGPLLSSAPEVGAVPAMNPLGIAGAQGVLRVLGVVWLPLLVVTWTAALAALAHRFHRASGQERAQLKWFFYAAGVLAAVYFARIGFSFSDEARPWLGGLVLLSAAALPVTVGSAVLQHRLYEIDRLINRTLAFGALWLGITFGYAGLAAALGVAVGGRLPAEVAVVCTILATLVFQPARRQLERLADRLVFGERLSGYDLLARFGATLEGAFDLGDLAPRLAAIVRRGLGVTWVRVSLQRGAGAAALEPAAADGIGLHDPATPAATAPLVHHGEQIGTIVCGPKTEGHLDAQDHELLATLGRQAALAIHNASLASELRRQAQELAASRTRIVQAAETERRRIERNIHDGAQQELVALLARLRLARNQLARDPQLAASTLAELQDHARQALEDLRELARGIHPPVLSDRGLLEAIEARVARLPVAVSVEADGLARGARFADEIEGAAYFLVCEGLANALKHAAAQRVAVRLSRTANTLHVTVVDDGRGFDLHAAPRSGLRGLADRIEAVGGRLHVASTPGGGAALSAELPARRMDTIHEPWPVQDVGEGARV